MGHAVSPPTEIGSKQLSPPFSLTMQTHVLSSKLDRLNSLRDSLPAFLMFPAMYVRIPTDLAVRTLSDSAASRVSIERGRQSGQTTDRPTDRACETNAIAKRPKCSNHTRRRRRRRAAFFAD